MRKDSFMNNPRYAGPAILVSLFALITFLMLLKEIKAKRHYVRGAIAMGCMGAATLILWKLDFTSLDDITDPLWLPAGPGCATLILFPVFVWTDWYADFWLTKRRLSSPAKEVGETRFLTFMAKTVRAVKWLCLGCFTLTTLVALFFALYSILKGGRSL
jgi:hypothetical protein